jgi:S-formylglutathione hydrolase FrmB
MPRRSWLRCARALAAAAIALAICLPAGAGTIAERTFHSAALGRDWSYNVYVPDGYASSGLRYPVLYLLHGYGGNRGDWIGSGHIRETLDALIAAGAIPACLVAMPDGGTGWYLDATEKMETALVQDLPADVGRQWRTLGTRAGRLIGGYSMGGYGALRLALRYPGRFAAAALLSPAIYDPEPPRNSSARQPGVFGAPKFSVATWQASNYPALWDAYLTGGQPVPMYIASGNDDVYLIEKEAARLYGLLRRNGQPAQLRIVDGGHDWSVWSAVFPEAMRYIFTYAARPEPVTRH